MVHCAAGQTVQFPASLLQQFITPELCFLRLFAADPVRRHLKNPLSRTRRACLPARFGYCWQHADSMNRYEFYLRITADQYLDYYRGTVRHVMVRCATGQTVQFPASLLQQFVTPEGICGNFVLTCDEHHRRPRLERLK
jgi:hypothetical protein